MTCKICVSFLVWQLGWLYPCFCSLIIVTVLYQLGYHGICPHFTEVFSILQAVRGLLSLLLVSRVVSANQTQY